MLAFVTLDMQFPLPEALAGASVLSFSTGGTWCKTHIKLFLNLEPLIISESPTSLTWVPIVDLLEIEMHLVWFISLIFKDDRFHEYAICLPPLFVETLCSQWWHYAIKKPRQWKLSKRLELPLKTLHPNSLLSTKLHCTHSPVHPGAYQKQAPPTSAITDPLQNLHPNSNNRSSDSQYTWGWDPVHSMHMVSCDDNDTVVICVPTCSPGLSAES